MSDDAFAAVDGDDGAMNGDDGSDDCLNQGLPGRKDANQLHNGDHLRKLTPC